MPRLVIAAGDPLQGEEAARDWLPQGSAVTRRSGDELSAETLFSDLGQQGFFAETVALLYTDILAAKLNKKEGERLTALLTALPGETWLACVQVISEDTKSKAETKLKSAGMRLFAEGTKLLDIREQAQGAGAARWLSERAARRYELRLTQAQAARVLSLSSDSPSQAEGELQKLALLREGAGQWAVPDSVLDELLSGSPAARFYALTDLLLEQPQAAQPMLLSWFETEPETFRLVFELKRRLLQARSANRGEPVYPPFAARGAQALARRLSGPRLGRAFESLAALEHGLKSGAWPAENSRQAELGALQLFTADLARLLRG